MKIPLIPGYESEQKINIMLSLTKIDSDDIKQGVIKHLVKGDPIKAISMVYDIPESNIVRAIKRLNEINTAFVQIQDLESLK